MEVYISAKVRNYTNPFTRYSSIENHRCNYRFVLNPANLQSPDFTGQIDRGKTSCWWRLKQLVYAILMLALPIKTVVLTSTYTSLIVAASLLTSNEAKGQAYTVFPIGNMNVYQSLDTTQAAKKFNKLKTPEQIDSIAKAILKEDWTDNIGYQRGPPYTTYTWDCDEFSAQVQTNCIDWPDDMYYGNDLLYHNNHKDPTDLEALYTNGGTLKDKGKYGLPICQVLIIDSKLESKHKMLALASGNDLTKLENWNLIEPQNDETKVQAGDNKSVLPVDIEKLQIYQSYVYKNETHEKNWGQQLILEFKVVNGKGELTYNINNDNRLVVNTWEPRTYIPLNERTHLITTRKELEEITDVVEYKTLPKNQIKVYPNPAREYINIETTINEPTTINMEIYDITGRLVEEYHSNEYNNFKQQIDVKKLATGTYLIKAITDKCTFNGKFVKR